MSSSSHRKHSVKPTPCGLAGWRDRDHIERSRGAAPESRCGSALLGERVRTPRLCQGTPFRWPARRATVQPARLAAGRFYGALTRRSCAVDTNLARACQRQVHAWRSDPEGWAREDHAVTDATARPRLQVPPRPLGSTYPNGRNDPRGSAPPRPCEPLRSYCLRRSRRFAFGRGRKR
jgi:hypothetical protein